MLVMKLVSKQILCALMITIVVSLLRRCSCDLSSAMGNNSCSSKDIASCQLQDYLFAHLNEPLKVVTTNFGREVDSVTSVLTVGSKGPLLLTDFIFLEQMRHFDRERIPERVVHAKAAGACGYFEVTHDITQWTKACIFERIGKRTKLAIRLSTVTRESGSADTVRDLRGFAVKFYTDCGNWDLVGNNSPIFFIRDPALFSLFIHSVKRNPATHLRDLSAIWDFITLRPESTHQVMIVYSDRGIPKGFRHMHGYGSHTFKLVNKTGEVFYCKFHFKTNQGIENIAPDEAMKLAGSDPNYAIRDLYNAIARGDYPSWTLYIQIMTPEQAKTYPWDPFDVTKVWLHADHPLIPVGNLTLTENPTDYFSQVEQIAFCPSRLIEGVEFSPDRMLQGRIFSYGDTQMHRLGVNFLQIPVNQAEVPIQNYQRDGGYSYFNPMGAPNYYPNSFKGPEPNAKAKLSSYEACGQVDRYDTRDEDNYSQPRLFWTRVLNEDERTRLVDNIVDDLKDVPDYIQERVVKMFSNVAPDMGERISARLVQADTASSV